MPTSPEPSGASPEPYFGSKRNPTWNSAVRTQAGQVGTGPGNVPIYGSTPTEFTGYLPIINGSAITLPELFGAGDKVGFGGTGGWGGGTPMEAIKNNIALNGGYFKPIMQTVYLNVGFAVGKRVFSKQLGLVRQGLKLGGLSGMVKV